MTPILAIDTSNALCTVALNYDGEIVSRSSSTPRQHARELLPMIHELLSPRGIRFSDLAAIAFVSGPGSFTGLRIGVGVVQGLAFASKVPTMGVSSLAVIARRTMLQTNYEQVLVSLQAREGEIYSACYQASVDHDVQLVGEELVESPQAFVARWHDAAGPLCLAGDSEQVLAIWTSPRDDTKLLVHECTSDASTLSMLARVRLAKGAQSATAMAMPVYLKEQMEY